jgi:hypothetical protein
MEWITLVKRENVRKAEEILRHDFDLAAKQSITIKDSKTLGFKEEGSFFYIKGSDEGVKKCKELIKEFAQETKEADKVKKKIHEEEESAAAGMGGIFG